MNSEDFHKEIRAQFQRQQDIQRHEMEIKQDRDFQTELQSRSFEFEKEQTDRFIREYKETNKQLLEINESLQKQIDETKREAETAKKEAKNSSTRAWISIGIAGGCALIEVISLALKAFHIL